MKILTKSKEKEITEALIKMYILELRCCDIEVLQALIEAEIDIGWAIGGRALCEKIAKEATRRMQHGSD